MNHKKILVNTLDKYEPGGILLKNENKISYLREIEFINKEWLLSNKVVLSTYFTGKLDPQNKITQKRDNYQYFECWYKSIVSQKLQGIIFYDELSDGFISKYNNRHICFLKTKLGKYSLNDERFFIYYNFLKSVLGKLDYVLLTDISDVQFLRDPFNLINKNHKIYIGRDSYNKLKHSKWMMILMKRFEEYFGEQLPKDIYNKPLYNAGIIGGGLREVLYTIENMCEVFLKLNTNSNNNMAVLNFVLYNCWCPYIQTNIFLSKKIRKTFNIYGNNENIITGFPLVTRFNKNEFTKGAYIKHK